MRFYIKEAREQAKLSQKQLANMLKISPSTLNGYEKGKHDPKSDMLIQIAGICNVSVDYLIGCSNNPVPQVTQLLSESENVHIKKYRALDSHGKKIVDFVLSEEYTRSQEQAQSTPELNIIYLPYLLQATSAGTGDFADDESADQIPVIRNAWTSKADYILRVHGDSMEPEIHDGDRLLVRRQPAADPGETGIFIHRGERYVKVYRESFLESCNPNYENIPVEEDTRCIGKVICVLDPEWILES